MVGLPKLMIVEDEEQIREQLLLYFSDLDEFSLAAAGSAEEALDQLRREPVAVCIVDIRLPGMDGEAFIRTAAAFGYCRHFIVHTGSVGLELSEELRNLGVEEEDVFLKPCRMDLILERVRTCVRQR